MVPIYVPILITVCTFFAHVGAIMVPTGKLGPITPAKPASIVPVAPAAYRVPAPVWERIDEAGSGYTPPIFKYILWDYVQKYGHHTLIPRPEDYYTPKARTVNQFYYNSKMPSVGKGSYSYHKNNGYYSPRQFL